MPADARPAISVCLITYNHGDYIGEALDSVLAQTTTLPLEVVVGDDASTDGTRERALEYQARHPDIIRVLPAGARRGVAGNVRATLAACEGEYVALLEGDDYWTSPTKLQRQVAALEVRPDCVLCFHPVLMKRESAGAGSTLLPDRPAGVYTLEDLLRGNFIPTGAVVFRRSAYSGLPQWLDDQRLIDWPLFVQIAVSGNLLMLADVMGVYRIHGGGVWSARSAADNRLATTFAIEQVLGTVPLTRRQRAVTRKALAGRLLALAWDFAEVDAKRARAFARRSLLAYCSPGLVTGQVFAIIATHTPRLAAVLRWARRRLSRLFIVLASAALADHAGR